MTGMALVRAKEAELTSMAIRITTSNSPQYHADESEKRPENEGGGTYVDFAWGRQNKKREVDAKRKEEEVQPIMPLMKGMTKKRIGMNAKVVEKNREAVCTEFAQLAATKLDGNGVRVEIIGSMKTNHNWVVLGRAPGSNLTDTSTWGGNAAIVDCWWGAMYWESYGEMPKVVYECWEHTNTYNNQPESSYWDSSAVQEVNAGAREENDFSFAHVRNLLSGKNDK